MNVSICRHTIRIPDQIQLKSSQGLLPSVSKSSAVGHWRAQGLVRVAAVPTALWSFKREAKANGLRGDSPCAMGYLPATDRLEAKQLRVCLLSKRVLKLRQKSKVKSSLSKLELRY